MDRQNTFITTRDLIPVGIFTAITLVIRFIVELFSLAGPAVWVFMPIVNVILLAPVYMLMISKLPRVGVVLITGIITGLFFLMVNGTWVSLTFYIVSALLADLSRLIIGCRKKGSAIVSYILYSLGSVGQFVTFLVLGQDYLETLIAAGLDEAYVVNFTELLRSWVLPAISVGTAVAALIMAYVAIQMVAKNFQRENIF